MSNEDNSPQGSWLERTKHTFSSWHNFHQAIVIKDHQGSLSNRDLLPTPPERQTWNWFSFFCYWFSEAWAIATWSIGSTMIAAGMTVAESILTVFFGNLIISIALVFNSRAAAKYHLGYPVLARSVFGIYAHYFFIVLRAILGIIWGGVQLYFEGQFISIMLRCIFPGWMRLHNTIPASQFIDLQTFLGFFFAFLITLPLLFVHTYKLRHLFTVKSVLLPFAGIGIVAWAAKLSGGIDSGVIVNTSARGSTTLFAFAVLAQLNALFGASCALVVTVPDLARYAKSDRSQFWGQILALPVSQTVCGAFGILTTAAVQQAWGEMYWNPYDLLSAILDHSYTSKARAGVFFAAFSFAFMTLGTSIACNIIPFAADVTCLLPKYLNIPRGQILCLVIAFAIVPWRILTSAATFLNFLGGYSIFQGSVVGIMCVDYFLVHRGNLKYRDLYTFSKDAAYYYSFGVNWRSIAAFIVGFALPFPGFCATLAGKPINVAALRMYDLGWLLSITTGSLSYYLICLVCPVPQNDKSLGFEELIEDPENATTEYYSTGVDSSDDVEKIGSK
ncbi:allantoin permease [Trichomonascus vanleenenianus]|uniref:nucleobase cation symporter-1 family protein n=1 Tax=Trichomonascus vanleenenianus TaxID=2268995 RepID=UPI003EC9F5E9